MEVNRRQQAGCEIIDLCGEFDFLISQDVKEEILAVIQSGISHLIINLAELKYVDSTGLGILITAWTKCREYKVKMKYAAINGSVAKVITLSRLDNFLPITATVEDAIRELQV